MYWFCHTSTWIRQCPDSASDAGDIFASTTSSAALLATPTDPHQGSFYRDPKRLRFGRSWLIPKTNNVPLNPVLASNRPSERRFGGGENTGFGTDIPGYYTLLSKEPQIKHYHLSGFHLTFKDVAGFRKNTYSCRMRAFYRWGLGASLLYQMSPSVWRQTPGLSPTPSQRRRKSVFVAILCFPCGSDSKESACSAGDLGSIPGLGRSPGGGHSNPL